MCKSRSPSELEVGLIFLLEDDCSTFDVVENDLERQSFVKALVFKRQVLGHDKKDNNYDAYYFITLLNLRVTKSCTLLL
jgi:hypothetical protein